MLDLYIKENISLEVLADFLAEAVSCRPSDIRFLDVDKLGTVSLEELSRPAKCCCFLVYAKGDVFLRADLSGDGIDDFPSTFAAVQKTIQSYDFHCYILFGDFDDAVKISKHGVEYGRMDEERSVDGYFFFDF